MTTDTFSQRPYRPCFIHAFDAWLDRLPFPPWAFFLFVFFVIGIAQHLVAWGGGWLAPGKFSLHLGTAGYWLVAPLLIFHYALKGAAQALEEYHPLLNTTEEEYARLKYGFLTIPSAPGTVMFIIGVALGVISGFSDRAAAPAIDYVFPQLRIGIWMIATGLALPFLYQLIRQLQQITAFYAMHEDIDLFNLRPLYGFSRYTAVLGIALFLFSALFPELFDPTTFASQFDLTMNVVSTPLILLMFFLPLWGVHRRLSVEKDHLMEEVNTRIATIQKRIYKAAFEEQGYENVADMRMVLSTLMEEKQTIEGLRTWPWRPGTLTGLVSALLLPVLLMIVREIISMLIRS